MPALTPPRANLVQLVAMGASGSSYVTKQMDETLWLVHPDGSDETEPITIHDVAMAVTFHNFEMVADAP